MIRRQIQDTIEARIFSGKAIIVIGARQVGKSTLFKMVLENRDEPTLMLNCDEPVTKSCTSGKLSVIRFKTIPIFSTR